MVRHGGQVLADQLALLGAQSFFCVPGESFLGLLDGLYAHEDAIKVITCRHESGASNMADAWAKMTGKPGICAMTRGPGATNGSNGVHTAFQDSTPMIVLLGQVGRSMQDREAFQEMDYRRVFGEMAKWVAEIDDPVRIPEYISRAWTVCQSGRPGPVVLALPEDVLSAEVEVSDCRPITPPKAAPRAEDMRTLAHLIENARKPMMVVGGPGWSAECSAEVAKFSDRTGVPFATTFRCQDYGPNDHPHHAGVLGIAPNPALRKAVREECDLLIAVGTRFGEISTQGYTLLDVPVPQMDFVHVHPGPEEIGMVYSPTLGINAGSLEFLKSLNGLDAIGKVPVEDWAGRLNESYRSFQTPTDVPGPLNMGAVVRMLDGELGDDAIICNGAGNYTVWVHRFYQHKRYRTQLAPTSGSMGYSVPAAVAAKLAQPEREVVSVAGDGCFLMTGQEMATAARYDLPILYLVVNNGMYGTIRMHQERHHPGRVISTGLTNPDFVAYAASFGIPGEVVDRTEDFAAALARWRGSSKGYMIELQVDPEALTPTQSLSAARAQGEGK